MKMKPNLESRWELFPFCCLVQCGNGGVGSGFTLVWSVFGVSYVLCNFDCGAGSAAMLVIILIIPGIGLVMDAAYEFARELLGNKVIPDCFND